MFNYKILNKEYNEFKYGMIIRGVLNYTLSSSEVLLSVQIARFIQRAEQSNIQYVQMALFALIVLVFFAILQYMYLLNAKSILVRATVSDKEILAKVLDNDARKIERNDSEDFAEELIINGIEMRWGQIDYVASIIEFSLGFITLVIIGVFTNMTLALVCVCFAIIQHICNQYFVKREVVLKKAVNNAIQKEKGIYLECFKNIQYIIFNSLKNIYISKIASRVEDNKEKSIRLQSFIINKELIMNLIDISLYIVLLVSMYAFMQDNKINSGDFVVLLFFYRQTKRVLNKTVDAKKAKENMNMYAAELEEYICDNEINKAPFESLHIEGTKYAYDEHMIELPNIKLNKGEKVAFVGKNGSGKSTALKVISGIYQTELDNHYAYDYIDANAFIYNDETSSGGERKAIELKRVKTSHNNLVLIDEPETFLDQKLKQEYLDYIKTSEKTIVIATHDRDFMNAVEKVIEF